MPAPASTVSQRSIHLHIRLCSISLRVQLLAITSPDVLLGGRVERTAVVICFLVSLFTLLPHASLSVQQQEPVRCTETPRLAAASWPDLRVGSVTALLREHCTNIELSADVEPAGTFYAKFLPSGDNTSLKMD